MERDCVVSQGCSYMVKDRLTDQSDRFDCYVCKYCGMIAIANPKTRHYECSSCETDHVYKITMPYGTKMVFQELIAMNVVPRILINKKDGTFKIMEAE